MNASSQGKRKKTTFLLAGSSVVFGAALNAYTTALEVNSLQEKLGTADNIFKEHNEGKTDVGVFPIHNYICRSVNAIFVGSRKWDVP